MTTTKSHFEQILFRIYPNSFCKYNQKVRMDCLKPRSNKVYLSVKTVVAMTFMCLIIKILHLKYCPVWNV